MEQLAEELYKCLRRKRGTRAIVKSLFMSHVKKCGCTNIPSEVLHDGMLLAAKLLLTPSDTLEIAASFPYLLVELLSLATVELEEGLSNVQKELKHQQEFVALAKLSKIHPDALKFSFYYFETRTPKFVAPSQGTDSGLAWVGTMTPLDIAQSFHLFLQSAPLHFRRLWNWPEIVAHYLPQGSMLTWLSVQCAAIMMHMNAAESSRLALQHLSATEQQECMLAYEALNKEFENVADCMSSSRIPPGLEATVGPCRGLQYVVPVAGVLLPIVPCHSAGELFLHVVPTTKRNLHRLAVAVVSGKAVCLAGPVGSGKTDVVEQLARLTGRDTALFVKLQMSEEIDSKLLVGTYTTTSTLGEFKWEPGILTTALLKGQWLLVEDIDLASPDVAAVLSSVLEQGSLLVPGCEQPVAAATGFHLFFTRRNSSQRYASSTNLLQEHWLQVVVHPLTKKELLTVVKAKFPLLEKWASRIIHMYMLFSDGNNHLCDGESEEQGILTKLHRSHNSRHTSTRDLIKYCQRIDRCEEQTLFRHALDIFCSNIADKNTRVKLAVEIGFVLGLAENISYQFCTERVPHFEMRQSNLQIGTVKLEVAHSAINSNCGRRFSWTLPAATVMESVACCVLNGEPVLLVGETATGKTLMVQHLADLTGNKVVVVNMSQQNDPADLLGGYKPVNMFWQLHNEFEVLLESCLDRKIKSVLAAARKFFNAHNWSTWLCLLIKISKSNLQHYKGSKGPGNNQTAALLEARWFALHSKLDQLDKLMKCKRLPSLKFVEGTLVKAVEEGYWILLDEINLATPETLHCLSSLLESRTSSLQLLERADRSSVERHPHFRLFACMNPSTDVGKRELPQGLRNRFTEIYVDEMTNPVALISLVQCYLQPLDIVPSLVQKLVKFYLSLRSSVTSLADGTGRKPHYSLRTLCRALSIAAENKCGSAKQSLFEGLCIAFLTQLKRSCYVSVEDNIRRVVFGNKNSKAKSVPPPKPNDISAELVEGYWISQGTLAVSSSDSKYVLTDTVRANLRELSRAVSLADCPILLQGPTSVGKTSLITYLAACSGNHCVRINNHEHTDLQEYVGMHAADNKGQLVFQYGVLVQAMKNGYWLILDELNLAPTDVLEALNRLLDDNRELYITETQEVVKAHKNFRIFATQNPPGVYGGRKVLSRAFRNRFVELHFDSIPSNELQEILHKCCSVPPNCCRNLVSVMNKLQLLRRGSATFAGRQGFMTLRDLFRWARRYHVVSELSMPTFYDWDQHMAEEGFLLLTGRVRKAEERVQIQETIEKVFKKDLNPDSLFDLNATTSLVTRHILQKLTSVSLGNDLVWTRSMRQMAVLVCKAHQYDEPVLLVGGTGCGKTTLCEKMAKINGQQLYTINCHMNSESSDFLGGLRPTREHSKDNKLALFEWVDGPLVLAMKEGNMFLADEISLAEDSVLERLNPLLEPDRTLLLSEKGSDDHGASIVKAHSKFQFVGTMNPGGDFGKKELSPALRNRFTEIWCEPFSDIKDLEDIINFYLCPEVRKIGDVAKNILKFIEWYKSEPLVSKIMVSIRDILTWVSFINKMVESQSLPAHLAFIHGGMMTLVNGMCVGDTGSLRVIESEDFEIKALHKFKQILKWETDIELVPRNLSNIIISSDKIFGIGDFKIEKGASADTSAEQLFVFKTAQTCEAALHVLRSMQLHRPILLEGSPGVGKTALVQALASCCGFKLVRINLSEQTDVSDLFGADLPVENGEPGHFAWHDGPFLQALKAGDWILLDELNLSSQSILEGLNACLDHRGEVYIPELGKTFYIQKDSTRIFATQNPTAEGGGRKGLPKSFLNRFLKVYIKRLRHDTYKDILYELFPRICYLGPFLKFVQLVLEDETLNAINVNPGSSFNLRDACRWCKLVAQDHRTTGPISMFGGTPDPRKAAELVYFSRMRTDESRNRMIELYNEAFGESFCATDFPMLVVAREKILIGDHVISLDASRQCGNHICRSVEARLTHQCSKLLLRSQVPVLNALLQCVTMAWHPLLIGGPASGKTSVVHLLAELVGMELRVLPMNSAMDTMEILGGFEQWNIHHHLSDLISEVDRVVSFIVRETMLSQRDGLSEKVWNVANEWWRNTQTSKEDGPATIVRQCETMKSVLDDLVAQWKVWNPECCHDLGISELLRRLERVQEESTRELSSGGGKFEWVDSLLVKCLKDGAWLLVENVNLCSPAVLDRLNALLEPNGVLSVDERGVGPDNKVVTVRPHPNFRILFTMNPEYGEVSRAMRNRCVEIFMKPMSHTLSKLDSHSLLANSGLQSPEILLGLQEILSFDTFGHMIWVANVASQQAIRGLDVNRALKDTILDMHYVKPGKTLGKELEERLDTLINCSKAHSNTIVDYIDVRVATLKTAALNIQRTVSIMKQDCVLLSAFLQAVQHSNPQLTDLFQLLPSELTVDSNWMKSCDTAEMAVLFMVATFFSTANNSMNMKWVAGLLSDAAKDQFGLKMLISLVEKVYHGESAELAWDYMMRDSLNWLLLELTLSSANHMHLVSEKPSNNTIRIVDAPSYFGVLQHHPLVSRCGDIIEMFDKCLEKLLQSNKFRESDFMQVPDKVNILLEALLARNDFSAAVFTVMYENTDGAWMIVLSSLKKLQIYYKWFYDTAFATLETFLKYSKVNDISTVALHDCMPALEPERMTGSIASLEKHPPAWFSREWPVVFESLRSVSSSLSFWDKITERKIHLVMDEEYEVASRKVVGLISQTISDKIPSEEVVQGVGRIVEAAGRPVGKETLNVFAAARVSLWPVQELLCVKLCGLLRKEMLRLDNSMSLLHDCGGLVARAGSALCAMPTVPLGLKVFMQALSNSRQTDDSFLRVTYEVATLLLEHAKSTPAANSTASLCLWHSSMETCANTDKVLPALHCPVLAVQLKQLLQNSEKFSLPTLDSSKARIMQLKALHEMLWRNMVFFTSPETNIYCMDRQCALLAVENITVAAREAVEAPDGYSLENCIKLLQLQRDDVDFMLSAAGWVECAVQRLGKDKTDWEAVGLAWVGLGLLQAKIQELHSVTDWEKREALVSATSKVTYLSKRLFALECWSQVKMCSIQSSSSLKTHPAIFALMKCLTNAKISKQYLEETMPERPNDEELQNMSQARSSYLSSITSPKTISRLLSKLSERPKNCNITAELELLLGLNERHSTQLRKYCDWFPDYILPVMLAAAQISYGLSLLRSSEIGNTASVTESVKDYLMDLIRYPVYKCSDLTMVNVVQRYLETSELSVLLELCGNFSFGMFNRTLLRLQALVLQDIHSDIVLSGELDPEAWECVKKVLKYIVELWRKQKVEAERKKQEEESLYTSRTKTHCESMSDEELFKQDMERLFHVSEHQDFRDLEDGETTITQPIGGVVADDTEVTLITDEYLHKIHVLHSQIVSYTICDWLAFPKIENNVSKLDHLSSLLERCQVFNNFIEGAAPFLSENFDQEVYTSYLLMTSAILKLTEDGTLGMHITEDFYSSSNISEVVSVIPILKTLLQEVNCLLSEWPENPILVQILTVAERILSFPMESPVSRFLTGLEILLPWVEEWEVNAHQGVSLASSILELNKQILSWKKLELSSWKGLLSAAEKRAEVQGSQWWPHLYELLHFSSEPPSKDKFLEVVWQFMHDSTLGEFHTRHQMLYTFHCDAVSSNLDDKFENVLWNVYKYYAQFLEPVKKMIVDQRTPVEKKLKDLVKISSWNYSNVAALKKKFEKSKRAIVKHIREYEAVLKQRVFPAVMLPHLNLEQHTKALERLQALQAISANQYLTDISFQKYKEDEKYSSRSEEECYFKFRDLCKDVISENKYGQRICAVHEWSAETFATYVHLTNLQVDRSASVEKQKSWAKNSLQQKRRFISNLFKELQMFGFSHRWGAGSESSVMDLMFLPPVDVAAIICQLDSRPIDVQLVDMWKESEPLFHKNIARLTMLRQALNNPSKDMEMHLIGRMRGSTSHIMAIAEQERLKLSASLRSLCTLRYFTWQLTCARDTIAKTKPWKCQSEAKKTLVRACTYLSQLSQVFDSYPQSPCSDDASKVMDGPGIFLQPLFVFGGGGASNLQEESAVCNKVKVVLKEKEHILREKLYLLQQSVTYKPQPFEVNKFDTGDFQCLLPPKTQQNIDNIYETLLIVGKEIQELCQDKCQLFSGTQLTKHMTTFSETLVECAERFSSSNSEQPSASAVFVTQRQKVCFEAFSESNVMKLLEKVKKDESGENDIENILKILEKLDDICKALNTNTVVRDLYNHLPQFWQEAASSTDRRHLDTLVPLLEQFACVCQLFLVLRLGVCQAVDGLLATVLVIFEELAHKGYQIPEELMPDEEGKGDGGKGQGGMGLGDGEGEKDVSDRIESEDQLEEARPAGEKPPEDTDPQCPEENENGIDMTEDFDGEVGEAKEASDEDEGPEKSDGENEDDEMGSASDNEQDKPYWGSDQSGDEADDDDDGKGQEQNNKEKTQLGAKDQESTQDRGQDDRNEDINDMDDGEEAEDQVDPYHGNMEPLPEPEPLEIPEDLQLDDGDAGEEQNAEDESNPFDVDEMKEVEEKDKLQQEEQKEGSEGEKEEDATGDNTEEAMDSSENEHDQLPEEESVKESGAHCEEDENDGEAPNADEKLAENSMQQSNAEEEAMDADSGVQDQATVNPDAVQEDDGRRETDSTNDEAGVGQAERENDNSGHQGDKSHNQATKSDIQSTEPQQARSRQRPRESEHRTLGSSFEPVSKRLKTIEAEEQEASEKTDAVDDGGASNDKAAHQEQLYQHVDSADGEQDVQTLDTATKEQAQEKEWQNMDLDSNDETPEQEECPELKGEEMGENQTPNSKKTQKETTAELSHNEQKEKVDEKTKVEGEIVQTMFVERGQEIISQNPVTHIISGNKFPLDEQVSRLREQLLEQLASWAESFTSDESRQAWSGLCFLTNSLAQELSEQLRMILEPTRACRLKGDYKSGRRINMRKVIPYIASGFRKDKIWLRRTKLSKREYQILLAIDDSQSMLDNRSKELAFESLALVSQALVLLEAGHLGVVSFGEEPVLLHPLSEPFTDASGSRLVQRLEFKQARTRVGKLVEFATCVFSTQPSSHERAQLLIIISDGRGVDSEGPDVVRNAVQQAQEKNIFIVYIIMDNPQESILDVCSAVFDGGRPRLTPYMESFPFPFYLILKDINMLPLVLSDALRQWFELVASIEH